MRKNQKGLSSTLLIIAVVAVIAVVGIIFLKKQSNIGLNKPIPQTGQSSIQNSSDLNSASADLDNTNIDGLDSELNQVSSDASNL